jgi:hypothetical protein
MADNVVLPGTGSSVATDDIDGNQFQRMKLTLGADGVNDGDVSSVNPLPVAGQFYQATQPVTGPITDAELRAAAIAVSGDFYPATQPVSIAVPVAVTGGLTDTELRASPLVVTDATAAELLDGLQTLLLRLLNATNSPRGYDVGLARNRVSALIESGTVTTVGTVTNQTNQTNMGGQQAQLLTNGQNVSAWAATVRARIT